MAARTKKRISILMVVSLLLSLFAVTAARPVQASVPIGENMIVNGDMEQLLANWVLKDGFTIASATDPVHSGNFSARIAIDEGGGLNPYLMRWTYDLLPNTEYLFSAWVKITGKAPAQAVIPVEAFNTSEEGEKTYVGKYSGGHNEGEDASWSEADGKWHKIVNRFTTGETVNSAELYIRIYAGKVGAECYFDDVTLTQVGVPEVGTMDTDWWIYYSDHEEDGVATAVINDFFTDVQENGTVDFAFKDGTNVLKAETVNVKGGIATFTYPMSLLSQKQHEYKVTADIKDADGEVLGSYSRRVFKYDRPNYLTKDGHYIENGKRLYPFWGAGTFATIEKYSQPIYDAGWSMIGAGTFTKPESAVKALDEAHAAGCKVVLTMYGQYNRDGKLHPPAAPEVIDAHRAVVKAVKDHPALFAYNIMDEGSGRTEATDDLMLDSYRLIRDIDPNHPIYQTENLHFEWGAKTSDILGIDPYGRPETKTVARKTQAAVKAARGEKTVVAMIQAFKQGDGKTMYYPEPNEGRLSLYQALLNGAKGLSYYSFAYGGLEPGKYLDSSPLWGALDEFEHTDKKLVYDHFVFGDTPVFNRDVDTMKNVWYHSFVKDGNIYMIVTNSSKAENTVSIPMISYNQKVNVTDFTASVYSGAEEGTITCTDSKLNVTLKPNSAVIYVVRPSVAPDYSSLTAEAYKAALENGNTSGINNTVHLTDIDNYAWAKKEIEMVVQNGIANLTGEATYSPGTNITRADFAMFLVRSLGLISDSTENFADVDPSAYYAKEIAIGKALGILKGVGDGKYNPDASISRQDLMTICARGMDYAKKIPGAGVSGTVTGYPDADKIADYAMASVATMIREGIVKGNADGTINPLGNTTRAETAIIMYRILGK